MDNASAPSSSPPLTLPNIRRTFGFFDLTSSSTCLPLVSPTLMRYRFSPLPNSCMASSTRCERTRSDNPAVSDGDREGNERRCLRRPSSRPSPWLSCQSGRRSMSRCINPTHMEHSALYRLWDGRGSTNGRRYRQMSKRPTVILRRRRRRVSGAGLGGCCDGHAFGCRLLLVDK